MSTGTALKVIREHRKKTQTDVSRRLKVSQTYLSQIETEKREPSTEMLRKLCKYYKVPPIVVHWMAVEEKDVEKRKQPIFRELKPAIDDLIQALIK
jgi:transcriptional regulator with XRE-family HTH domain